MTLEPTVPLLFCPFCGFGPMDRHPSGPSGLRLKCGSCHVVIVIPPGAAARRRATIDASSSPAARVARMRRIWRAVGWVAGLIVGLAWLLLLDVTPPGSWQLLELVGLMVSMFCAGILFVAAIRGDE